MALKPTWQSLAQHVHAEPLLDVNVAHVDCIVSVELCTDKAVKKFPYLQYYGADSADNVVYEGGVRTFDFLLDYLRVASTPATFELQTFDEFEAKKAENPVMFVFAPHAAEGGHDNVGNDAEEWKAVFLRVARANRFDGKFYTAESNDAGPALATFLGRDAATASSPVAVVKGDEVVYYKGQPLYPLLKAWMWSARHPKVAEMTHKLASALKKERPDTLAVIMVIESFEDNSELLAAYEAVAKMKKKGWDYQFTWMDYHQWRPYIEQNWGSAGDKMPHVLVFKPQSQHYAPLRDVVTDNGNLIESNFVTELDLYASGTSVEWFGGRGMLDSLKKTVGASFETFLVIFAAMSSEYPMLIHASFVSTCLLILVWCTRKPIKDVPVSRKGDRDAGTGAADPKHAKVE